MNAPRSEHLRANDASPEAVRIRQHRIERLRAELRKRDYAAGLFCDPVNIRYATGSRNMQVWCQRNPARYVFVATDGPTIMFEFSGCEHLTHGLETIQETRVATGWFYFTAGPRVSERVARWARELSDLLDTYGAGNRNLAVDRTNPEGYAALTALGIKIQDGQEVAERARAIKSPDEISSMRAAIVGCERSLLGVQQALQPGITENQLLAILSEGNLAGGGEYLETRLLTAGPRTNPWYQESGDHAVANGDLLAVDTDMIGESGFFTDMSRTFLCGDKKPTAEQRELYSLAYEQIQTNMALLKPGVSFREFSAASWFMPSRFAGNRYMSLIHGTGLSNEYPYVPYAEDFDAKGYDGIIEENMTLCVESYIGHNTGKEGVKLEEIVLVTANGPVPLTSYPFDAQLLA
ncbi:putative peptidase [Caballeronia arvi]|uniref:Peptidase n=2 Tax=Caballeronia arvi TaxID=1777135 RepID=A0A158KQR7_9BURK|nr:putative peptidase [Caballeronia arvi]